MLSQRYQTEQQELAEKIERLNADLAAEQQSAVDAEKWVNLIKQYVNPTELTAELLNALIEKIVVHEAVKDESNTPAPRRSKSTTVLSAKWSKNAN